MTTYMVNKIDKKEIQKILLESIKQEMEAQGIGRKKGI